MAMRPWDQSGALRRTLAGAGSRLCLAWLLAGLGVARGAEPIRIAAIFAHTGIAAEDNLPAFQGAREAVADLNAKGGVLGRRLELIEHDDFSTPIGSKLAAENAVKEQVTAIVGAAWSSQTLAMAPIAQAHRVPMVTTICTADEITRVGDCIFRVCFNDAFQSRVMAGFARDTLHARTAVTVTDLTSDYSMGLAREFEQRFRQAGGVVQAAVTYRFKQADFTGVAAAVKAAGPDVVFIPGYWESAAIIKELKAEGSTAIPLGGDGWGTRDFYQHGGTDLVRGYYSTHWTEDSDAPLSRAFVARYKRGAQPIDASEALAYDAVCLVADALRRARSTEHEKLREALDATRNFQGVTGSLSYLGQRDPVRSAVIVAINNGSPQLFKRVQP